MTGGARCAVLCDLMCCDRKEWYGMAKGEEREEENRGSWDGS